MGKFIDLTGQVFGRLTVIERDNSISKNKGAYWICQCECGNIVSVKSYSLRSGVTKSCGCFNKEINSRQKEIVYMVGRKFGKLTVLERYGTHITKGGQKKPTWLCRCDCGNIVTCQGGNLRSGNTTSCGCDKNKSKGEEQLSDFLSQNHITYSHEHSFDDLRNESGNLLRFDFAVLDNEDNVIALIEYQGEQHYIDCGVFGSYQRNYSDKRKRDYCKSHNIPLYEIRFDEDLTKACNDLLDKIDKLQQK